MQHRDTIRFCQPWNRSENNSIPYPIRPLVGDGITLRIRKTTSLIAGMTLLELLVTLSIISMTVAYGLPSFVEVLKSTRQTAQINDFIATLLLARSHAINYGHYVLVCPSVDGHSCQPSGQWQNNWVVLASDQPLHDQNNIAGAQVIHSRSINPDTRIRSNRISYLFRPYGRRATNGTIIVCDRDPMASGKAIIVSYNGRARVSKTLANGDTINCST